MIKQVIKDIFSGHWYVSYDKIISFLNSGRSEGAAQCC